ncbi:MAG: DMT family transporter, partial [Gammaproteobacteria bacterium]|nr:DMT family transporter [Gammaproteobacteria bacterium]
MQSLSHIQAVWLMIFSAFLWSTAGPASQFIVNSNGFEITFWRSFWAALGVVLMLWYDGRLKSFRTMLQQVPILFIVDGICWSVMFTAYMLALSITSVSNVLITLSIAPLLTSLVARVVLSMEINWVTWMSIVIAGAGIAWMYGQQLGGEGVLFGGMIALAVPIAGAIHWNILQYSKSIKGQAVDLMPAVALGAGLSVLATLPFALPFQSNPQEFAILGLLGVFQLAIPCWLAVVVCAKCLTPPEISLLALLEVVFGIAL